MKNTAYKRPIQTLSQDQKFCTKILNAVAGEWGVSAFEVLYMQNRKTGKILKNTRAMTMVRRVSIYLAYKHSDMVMPDVAVYFKRSHTSCSKGNAAIEDKAYGEHANDKVRRVERLLNLPHGKIKRKKA
jgi:chromosomal replication initiation ATPase DnaA